MPARSLLNGPWPAATDVAAVGCAGIASLYTFFEDEYRALRDRAGLIDHSGLGCLRVEGAGATPLLQQAAARDIEYMFPERCLSSLLLSEEGDVLDLVVIYRLEDGYLVETSFGRGESTLSHLQGLAENDVLVTDVSQELVVIGLEGPDALQLMADQVDQALASMPYQGVATIGWHGTDVLVSRTGYTGEYGYKLFLTPGDTDAASEHLLSATQAVGLHALEVAMLEVRQPILHRELADGGGAVRCGFNWLIEPTKPSFIGRDALLAQHSVVDRLTVGFEALDDHPLDGGTVMAADEVIGNVALTLYSPGRGAHIGLARLRAEWAASGLELEVEGGGERRAIRTISSPYVVPRSWGGPVL